MRGDTYLDGLGSVQKWQVVRAYLNPCLCLGGLRYMEKTTQISLALAQNFVQIIHVKRNAVWILDDSTGRLARLVRQDLDHSCNSCRTTAVARVLFFDISRVPNVRFLGSPASEFGHACIFDRAPVVCEVCHGFEGKKQYCPLPLKGRRTRSLSRGVRCCARMLVKIGEGPSFVMRC